ncbi:Uncharacterized acetyltransferase At3g50280 [Linum grandiflorum]
MGNDHCSSSAAAMDKRIQIISSSIVEPSERMISSSPNQKNEIHSTPLDIQFLPVHYAQRGLLFPNPPHPFPTILPALISSLSRSLSIFPPFAGRLAAVQYDDGTASFSLHCNPSSSSSSRGALLVHAVSDGLSSSDVLYTDHSPAPPGHLIDSLFPINGAYGFQGVSNPLLAVQFTQLLDGVFMGITFSHVVADGSSFWHFLNTWSQISRNSAVDLGNPTPVIGHWFLDGIIPPIPFPFSFQETLVNETPPLLQRIFHFSKHKIALLKAKSNSELLTLPTTTTVTISSLQSILAHIWRAVIRNRRGLDPDEEVHCKLLVDYRQRLQPKLPRGFFGNAVLFGTATATVKELLREGIGYAALRINKTVERQTDGEARRWLDEKKPVLPKLGATARNSLIVADSPRFDVYGNDFGWGNPVGVRAAGNYSDGKLTALAGKEQGSVDVQVCLEADTMNGLVNDFEFMDFVG